MEVGLALRPKARVWWRVGHSGGPLRFPPKTYSPWQSRFDDPEKRVRTLYCATDRLTCFYEILAPFRPDATALAEMAATETPPEGAGDIGHVPTAWRRKHVLSPARIQLFRGSLINLDSVPVREQIARRYPWLLQEHGVDH